MGYARLKNSKIKRLKLIRQLANFNGDNRDSGRQHHSRQCAGELAV